MYVSNETSFGKHTGENPLRKVKTENPFFT